VVVDMTTPTVSRRETRAEGWVLPLSVLIVGSFMSVLDTKHRERGDPEHADRPQRVE